MEAAPVPLFRWAGLPPGVKPAKLDISKLSDKMNRANDQKKKLVGQRPLATWKETKRTEARAERRSTAGQGARRR